MHRYIALLLFAGSLVAADHRIGSDADAQALPADATSVILAGRAITDAALTSLAKAPGITKMRIMDTSITAGGLARLQELKSLNFLDLSSRTIGDAGMMHIAALEGLAYLRLNCTVGNAGVAQLRGLVRLKTLQLPNVDLDDAGIEPLKELVALERLSLHGTKVSDAAKQRLRVALPRCLIQ